MRLLSTFTRPSNTTVAAPAAPLDALRLCASTACLRAALTLLCSRHGQLLRLEILPTQQAGRRQALCFLRMQTQAQEQRVMRALGLGRFGGDLVLVVDLADASQAQDMAAGPTVSVSVFPAETEALTESQTTAAELWTSVAPGNLGSTSHRH